MKIYKVDIEYIKYLHNFDSRVQCNENYTNTLNQNRPYVGIVLSINGQNYFAPLEHPRPSHKNLKNNLHIYKIKGGKYGIIGLNNMIPIPDIALINFNINTDKNKNILVSQYIECSKNWRNIQNRAYQIYNKRITTPNKFEKKMFCDFALLEKKCLEYQTQRKNTPSADYAYAKIEPERVKDLQLAEIDFEARPADDGKIIVRYNAGDKDRVEQLLAAPPTNRLKLK